MEERRRLPGMPLLGALASQGRVPASNIPMVHGTPQVSGVPMVKGTPVPQQQAPMRNLATRPSTPHAPAFLRVRSRPSMRYASWLTISVTSLVIIASVFSALAFFLPPGISLQGSRVVSPGGTLHLHGDGFLPGSRVTLTLDDRVPLVVSGSSTFAQTNHLGVGDSTLLQVLVAAQSTASGGSIQVGLSGTFDVAVPVSQSWSPGGHTIRATESVSSLNLQSVELPFMVEPRPAKLVVTPVGLDFGKLKKDSKATQTVTVSSTGQHPLNWTANVGTATWLTLDTSAGTLQPGATQTIKVTASTTQLPPGPYSATLAISAGSESMQVPVTLKVIVLPTPTPTPSPKPTPVPPTPPPTCPPGYGPPPDCPPLPTPTPPQCPPGLVGSPPDCQPPPTPTPPQCPPGLVGSPPDCQPLPTPTPPQCPSGLIGSPPNCIAPYQPPSPPPTPSPTCPPGYGPPPDCPPLPPSPPPTPPPISQCPSGCGPPPQQPTPCNPQFDLQCLPPP